METRKLLSIQLVLLFITTTAALALVKERCHPHDKKVLLGIKAWFHNDPIFSTWLPDTDCCRRQGWDLVACDPTTHRIISFFISTAYANLSGTIPPSVADLPFLQVLQLIMLPNLTGAIPPSIATLRHLTFVRLSLTSLSGPVPSFFGRMRRLNYLSLAFNRFSGSIPPELARAPALNLLDLSWNRLTGPIPDSFGSFNQSGRSLILDLSHNQLAGPIPASMGEMKFLILDFSRNKLTGDASFMFGPDKMMQTLDLSRNQLSFDFSTVEMSSSLITSIDLNHNRLFGGFPATGLEQVYYLNVSYNRLCGAIPNAGQLRSFNQTAYLHNKCLCGPPLPACNSTAN